MYNAASSGPNESAIYYDGSPEVTKYSAGSRSWRTNNPGLLPANEITWPYGAIGEALGVAAFPNPEAGRRALRGYLAREENAGRTVDDLLRGFLLSRYTPPPRETDPATGEPLPWLEPETGLDLEQPPGGGQIPQLAELIERRLGYHPGVITKEPLDTGTLNEAARAVDTSPGNVLVNGRSLAHRGSGGQVCTIDICETPSGDGCKPRTYGNVAKSSDAAKTASSVNVNGHPVCHKASIFSRSSGDEAGRCGGVQSGTIKGKAEFLTGSPNVFIEGVPAARQFDLMVSNNRNTSIAPLQQPGGARPPFLDTLGALGQEPTPAPWRIDWRILGGQVKQLAGRWRLRRGPGLETAEAAPEPGQPPAGTELNPSLETLAGERAVEKPGYWETGLGLPEAGACDYVLRLTEADPWGSGPSVYDIPLRDYGPDGHSGKASHNRSTEAKPTGEEVAVPVVVGLYANPERDPQKVSLPWLGPGELTDKARHDSPHNQGWLYVYLDGFLWRELEVRGPTEDPADKGGLHGYADVNLESHMGKDIRPATVEQVSHLLLPQKIAGRKVKVEIAYSRVQWSWSRIVGYGGIHPADPRWERNAPVCLPQKEWPKATQRRANRFQRVDLSGNGEHWPAQPGDTQQAGRYGVDDIVNGLGDTDFAGFLDAHAGQGLPVLLLDDPLGWAKDKAYAYQSAWREMEEYINDLSNPDHTEEKKKQFPFAPWFDSAVLANRYFFAPAPDLDAPNIAKDQRKELVRAMDERNEWKRQLDLHDIQTALGTKHRKTLREKIKAVKQPLVDFLDDTNPELDRLTAVLDDWFALPAEPKGPLLIPDGDKIPLYGDHFAVMEELIARLADDEYSLDLQLETEPPSSKEQYVLMQNDPGRIFLKKLASVSGGHPLHSRLFPKQAGENRYAYVETPPEIPEDHDTGKLQAALKTSRRSAKFVREFVNHFSSLADKAGEVREALGRIIGAGLLQMPLEEVQVNLEELIAGDLKKAGYALAGKIVAHWEGDPIGRKIAERYAEFAKNRGNARNPIGIYRLDGATHVGQASLEDLRNGSAFSSIKWVRETDPEALRSIFISAPVVKIASTIEKTAQKLKNIESFNNSVLGAIALLEAWNISAAFQTMVKEWGKPGQDLARAQFGEALAGAASTVGMLWDEHNKRTAPAKVAAMNLTKKEAEKKLEKLLLQTARWANGLGTVANAYSVGMSGTQTYVNLLEGDDAAIAHAVKTTGFGMLTLVSGARTIVAIKVLKDTALGLRAAAFLTGPWGWLGLLLLVLGEILLAWVFKEDTPLEQWLYNGPFSRPQSPRQQIVYRDDGSKWLVGPKQNALKLDAFDRIEEVIDDNPYGLFRTTPEGAVVAREGDDYRIIGFPGDPIDKSFLAEFNAPNRAQRFNGHTPETDPEDQYGWWYEHPQSAAKALADAIFAPKVTLNHRRGTRIGDIDILEIRIDLGAFLDGKSLLFAELWRTERDGTLKDKPGEDKVMICTGEGSGPKTIRVEWPIIWSDTNSGIEHICVRVRLDLNGDGSLNLPMPLGDTGAIVNEPMPAKEEVECAAWRWEEIRTALHMHRGKWEKIQTEKGRASYLTHRERFESRMKQEKGEPHD